MGHFSGEKFFASEFPCARTGGDLKTKVALVDGVTAKMNDVLKELAVIYDQKRPDFGVNLFLSLANQQVEHEDLRSSLDCFHPTAKAHRILGTQLWNSMLNQSWSHPFDDWSTTASCVSPDTRLVTATSTVAHFTHRGGM